MMALVGGIKNLITNFQSLITKVMSPIQTKRTECEVYSRVTGYLRPVKQWNDGKQQEFLNRKMFKIKA